MTKRQTGAALALVAIVLLLVASFTKAWWVAEEGRASIKSGFLGFEVCEFDGDCQSGSWSDEAGRDGFVRLVSYAGYGALAGTLLLIGVLGFAAIRALTPTAPPPRSAGLAAAILAGVGLAGAIGYAFAWTVVDRGEEFAVGWAAYLYFLAAGAAIAGSILCRGSGETVAGAPMPAPESGVPACRQCGAPTSWNARHARYYCQQCAVYV